LIIQELIVYCNGFLIIEKLKILNLNYMKKIVLSLFLMFVVFITNGQSFGDSNNITIDEFSYDDEVKTVMGTIKINRISGFGGPIMSFTALNGEFAHIMGGGGGVILNNIFIGGYGEGVTNTLTIGGTASLTDFDFGHGGFWVGYEIGHKMIIHPVISSRIGWGSLTGYDEINSKDVKDNFFVLIPTISAEINLTRFFKVNIGAEYRRTFNVNNLEGLNDNNFSGLGVHLNFLFGWF